MYSLQPHSTTSPLSKSPPTRPPLSRPRSHKRTRRNNGTTPATSSETHPPARGFRDLHSPRTYFRGEKGEAPNRGARGAVGSGRGADKSRPSVSGGRVARSSARDCRSPSATFLIMRLSPIRPPLPPFRADYRRTGDL